MEKKKRKPVVKGKGTLNKEFYLKCNSKIPYETWKKIIKECLIENTKDILGKQTGYALPNDMGRILILVDEPYKNVETLYSVTKNNGECTEVFNFHSFGLVGKFHWKGVDKHYGLNMFKFRPNRDTLKKPLYHIFHSGLQNYIHRKDYELSE